MSESTDSAAPDVSSAAEAVRAGQRIARTFLSDVHATASWGRKFTATSVQEIGWVLTLFLAAPETAWSCECGAGLYGQIAPWGLREVGIAAHVIIAPDSAERARLLTAAAQEIAALMSRSTKLGTDVAPRPWEGLAAHRVAWPVSAQPPGKSEADQMGIAIVAEAIRLASDEERAVRALLERTSAPKSAADRVVPIGEGRRER